MVISIIIPTFNRAKVLASTLDSIYSQKLHSQKFEVIVVDNGSSDNTQSICKEYKTRYTNFFCFFDNTPGLLTGRHLGAELAKGEILAFIDDDVIVSSTWLKTIEDVMENNSNISLLTGPTLPFYKTYPPTWLDYFWSKNKYGKECGWLSLIDFGFEVKEIHPRYVWGLNFIIRKSTFKQLGGFHPDNISKEYQRFQGDGESGLCIKAHEQNLKALYHPGVMLYHQILETRLTFEYFDSRAFYQGVCDSFTSLRRREGLYKLSNKNNSKNVFRKIKTLIYYKLTNMVKFYKSNQQIPNDVYLLFERFEKKRLDGFHFHQKAFENDELVKQWVLKENYFDYKLPQI